MFQGTNSLGNEYSSIRKIDPRSWTVDGESTVADGWAPELQPWMQNVVNDVSLRLTAAGLAQTDTVVLLRLDSGALECKVVCSNTEQNTWKSKTKCLVLLSAQDWQIYMAGFIFHPHTTSNPSNTNPNPNPETFNTNPNLNCNPNQNHTPRTENSIEQIQLSVPGDGKCNLQNQAITLIICATVRQLQTHYCVISHYTRSILVVLLRMILTISCMSTYLLHACQWLSNVSSSQLQSHVMSIDCSLVCVHLVLVCWWWFDWSFAHHVAAVVTSVTPVKYRMKTFRYRST